MKIRVIMAAAVLGLLAGCGGLRGAAPDRIYVLRAAPASTPDAPLPGVLAVQRPAMQPGLETDRIALARQANELDYLYGSRWGETLPRVLSALAVESLGGNGGFATVLGAERAGVNSDYELLLTVRRFEAEYAGMALTPVARVTFECVLTAGAPRRVLGRCDADATEPVPVNRVGEIVAALERAAQRALGDVRRQAVAAAAQSRK